jgi:KRAB domain-containing zinc finger protein
VFLYLKILQVIESAQRALEGEAYVTLSLVPHHLHIIYQSLERSPDDPHFLDLFKQTLLSEFKIRVGFIFSEVNHALLASLLDPRTAKEVHLWNLSDTLLADCYEKIAIDCQVFHPTMPFPIFTSLLEAMKEMLLKSSETDPLKFWENSPNFSFLHEGVQSLLCIPASSAPSERVFSSAGLIVSKLKSRTSEEQAEKLIFLKMW